MSPIEPTAGGPADGDAICSAKACREPATWRLNWNNPRIHAPERRKTWLACDRHRAHLVEFLTVRGFLREVDPIPPCLPSERGPS